MERIIFSPFNLVIEKRRTKPITSPGSNFSLEFVWKRNDN